MTETRRQELIDAYLRAKDLVNVEIQREAQASSSTAAHAIEAMFHSYEMLRADGYDGPWPVVRETKSRKDLW